MVRPAISGTNRPEHSEDLLVGASESDRMPSRLEFEQWVPFPLERVFAFFSNPEKPAADHASVERHEADGRPPDAATGATGWRAR